MDSILALVQATASGRYWEHMGIEFVEAEHGTAVSRVLLREQHLNYNDIVHGGVISGLVDSAAGAAVCTTRSIEEIRSRPHATSDLHIVYMLPAGGSELRARARVVRAGRTALFTEIDVTDDRGILVARGLATFVISQARRGPAE